MSLDFANARKAPPGVGLRPMDAKLPPSIMVAPYVSTRPFPTVFVLPMNSKLIPAILAFRDDGTPFSPAYDDIYHSAAGAFAQAEHVFLRGNGLPERWRARRTFTIVETGFGIGGNFLATWAAWRADPNRCERLAYVAIEKH